MSRITSATRNVLFVSAVVVSFALAVFLIVGIAPSANAFGIYGTFRVGPGLFAVVFDGTVATSTVTSTRFLVNGGAIPVAAVDAPIDMPMMVVGAPSGTIAIGDTVTVSSTVENISAVANTSTLARKLQPFLNIAAVRAGSSINALDEYVMLYYLGLGDPAPAYAVNSSTLRLHVVRGLTDIDLPLTFTTSSIPANGFFLIASASGYSGSIAPDATYATSTDWLASTSTAIYITTTSTIPSTSTAPRIDVLDKVEWGATATVVTSTNATSSFAATVATTTLASGNVLVRKALETSTAATMASGGADSNGGNIYNTRNNAQDFVLLDNSVGQVAIIKNSQSQGEFPSSGGQTDTEAPFVGGSFPSGAGGEQVPTDLPFIGFGFSNPVNLSTVTSSTVSLVVQGQSTNLCNAVSYTNAMTTDGPPGKCALPPGTLAAGTTYVFTIKGSSSTPNVADLSGNALFQTGPQATANHDFRVTFTPTAGFMLAPQVPPVILGSYPTFGATGIPTNLAKLSLVFSDAMDGTSFGGVTLTPAGGGANLLNTANTVLSAASTTAVIPLTGALTAGASYTLTVPSTVKNVNGVFMPFAIMANFSAGSGADVTGPQVLGRLPNVTTGVPVNAVDIHIGTDDAIDASTITSSTFAVKDPGNNTMPGIASYDAAGNEVIWMGQNVFLPSTQYTVTLNASDTNPAVLNVVGRALQDTDGTANQLYQFSFTTAATTDTTGPGILFAEANQFSLAVTFDEVVKSAEARNIQNYTVTSGGNPVTLSSFNGNVVIYDAVHRTAIITNVALTSGAAFTVNVANIHDISGNLLDPTKVAFSGTVRSGLENGGQIGAGGGFVSPTGDVPTGFSSSSFGFVPQPAVFPFNTLAGFNSTYGVDLPISRQIASGGKVTLTFPSSFTVANATADAQSPANSDINGPGTGAVTITSVAGNDTSHTVTVTLGAATQNNSGDTHDFLHFDIANIGNSTIPKDPSTSGYTVDIRTANGTTTLESFTSMPFFITAGGSNNLTVGLTAAGATNGTTTIYLFSPFTGPLSSSTTAFSGGNATTTFVGLPSGVYMLMTDPIISLTGGTFLGQSAPQPVSITASTTKAITLTAVSALASSTVNIHASTAGKQIDVFAGGPAGFVTAATSTVNGTTTVYIYYPADGNYTVGVGPHMGKTFAGSPSAPDYVLPQPAQVNVSSSKASSQTLNFNLLPANFTITGVVQDGSGKAIANANVHAYSPQGGFGTFGQGGSNGAFSLNVAAGNYQVGAGAPGFPSSQEIPVAVDGSGNMFVNGATTATSSVILKLVKSGYKLSGNVTDGTNAVAGAPVWAYCDPGTANNACFGPSGHAEAQTDSLGSYTLYVGNGTWKVQAYIPGYGQQPTVTVTVSGADQTLSDFRPSATGTFYSVAGTVCTNAGADCVGGTGLANAFVRIEGTDASGNYYSNGTVTDSSGAYSFSSVPGGAGSSYTVEGFSPTLGKLSKTAAFTVTANVASKDLVVAAGRTITVNVVNAPSSFELFIRLTHTTLSVSNFLMLRSNASGTVQIPDGSTYQVSIQSPGFTFTPASVARTAGTNATYSTSTGQLALTAGGTQVALNVTFPAATVVGGTVRDDTSALVGNAWVDIADASNGIHFGSQANASGTYSLSVPDGTYSMTAYAPGYVPNPTVFALSGGVATLGSSTVATSSVNLTVTKTSFAISGTVTAGGNAAAGALVRGTLLGGGTSVVVADASGAFTLPVKNGVWNLSASANGYQSVSYASTITISGSSQSGIVIALSTVVNLGTPYLQSVTPSQGGSVTNSSGTVALTIPANALGSSASAGQVKISGTSNVVSTASARPIGLGQEIAAYDSSNNSITTLNDNITFTMHVASSSFAANGITSTSTAEKVKLAYFDSSVGDWVPIAGTLAYINSAGTPVTPTATLSNVDYLALTGSTDHLTVFGTITTSDSVAPSPPTNITGVAGSSFSLIVSWGAPTTNTDGSALTDLMEFEIYRDTSASGVFTTQVNTVQVASGTRSFTDSTTSAGVTYYYKVTAVDTAGNESAKSVVSSALTAPTGVSASVGGSGSFAPAPSAATSTAATSTSSTTPSPTSSLPTPTPAPSPSAATPSLPAPAVSAIFNATLKQNMEGKDVTRLQKLLASDPAIYPEGKVTGYFGPLTRRAVERFQTKYGLVSSGSPTITGYGLVGPKTRAKLVEVFGGAVKPPGASAPGAAPTLSPAAAAAIQTQIDALRAQLTELLKQLTERLKAQGGF